MFAILRRRRLIAQRNRFIDEFFIRITDEVEAGLIDSDSVAQELQRARVALEKIGIIVRDEQDARFAASQ